MARRKISERNVRKLYKNYSGSVQVTLPIGEIRKLGWRDGQKVVIERSGRNLLIRDWKP